MLRLLKTPDTRRKMLVFTGDLLLMLAAVSFLIFLHAFLQRYGVLNIRRPLKPLTLYLCIPVHVFLCYIFEAYNVNRKEKLRTLVSLSVISFLAFCSMFGLAKLIGINQTTMVYIAVLFAAAVGALYFWRLACGRVLLGSRHFIKQRVLFIETDATTDEILDEIKRRDYKVLGILTDDGTTETGKHKGLKAVGSVADLAKIAHHRKPNLLITAANARLPLNVLKTVYRCKFSGCEVYDSAFFYELLTRKTALRLYTESESIPYLNVDAFARRHYRRIKTITDIALACLAVLLLCPLMLIAAILIKLTSRGPVFFTQERTGLHEKPFKLIKFRTMVVDAEQNGPQWSGKDDPRVTFIGRILRKTRLDELPQLLNICKGQMSFIGPRPIRQHMAAIIEEKMPFYSLRFTVKPGLTGWAQVNYDYGGSVEGHIEKFQYDMYYLKHASAFLDLFILLKTIQTVIRRPAC